MVSTASKENLVDFPEAMKRAAATGGYVGLAEYLQTTEGQEVLQQPIGRYFLQAHWIGKDPSPT